MHLSGLRAVKREDWFDIYGAKILLSLYSIASARSLAEEKRKTYMHLQAEGEEQEMCVLIFI